MLLRYNWEKMGFYLSKKGIFIQLLENFKDKILLIVAFQDNQKIASTLIF